MREKWTISLLLFLFPSLTVPVLAVFFLRGIPGAPGAFFSNYSAPLIWGSYLILLIAWIIFYRVLRAATRRDTNPIISADASHPEA